KQTRESRMIRHSFSSFSYVFGRNNLVSLYIKPQSQKNLSRLSQARIMASQKTIVNFFKPVNKRPNSETQNEEKLKKAKVVEEIKNAEEKENNPDSENSS
ncbi:unnamed protein product, partial [Meganyctiphanes norvegica]